MACLLWHAIFLCKTPYVPLIFRTLPPARKSYIFLIFYPKKITSRFHAIKVYSLACLYIFTINSSCHRIFASKH